MIGIDFIGITYDPYFLLVVFNLQVSSDTGADGEGRANTISITQVTVGEITCHYTMFNIYNSGDPTIAELYFACFSDVSIFERKFGLNFCFIYIKSK